MRGIACLALSLLFYLPAAVFASALSYSIEGIRGKPAKNVAAWLGDEPETVQQRSIFLAVLDQRVRDSLKALGYYRPDVELRFDKSQPQWQLTIVVAANDPVLISRVDIRLAGSARDNQQFHELLHNTSLVIGNTLHHGDYESFKTRLLRLGQRLGYFDGEFTVHRIEVDVPGATASIELEYDSGTRYRFGSLLFDREQFDDSSVDMLRTFQRGELYDLGLLQQFQAQLQQTQFFSSVVVRPQMGDVSDKHVPILLRLTPRNRHSFDLGVGFSTDTRERLSFTWRSPKLNRYGHSQETRFEYSTVNPSGRVTYNIPLTHPLNDILQLTARVEDNEFGDIDSNQKELSVRREFRTTDGWIRSYFLRGLKESWEVIGLHNQNEYLLPGLTFSHKRREGSMVDPSGGFSQLYRLEGGSEEIGSDIDLLRVYSQFHFVATFAARHRLVTRAEIGAIFIQQDDRQDLAPSLGFFAGGSQSIRGFGYQSLGNEVQLVTRAGDLNTLTIGGDRLLTGSLEYQYYLNDSWRGAVFIDAGDAFDEGEFDLNYGAGFGLHYLTPVGAIKFELANSLSEDDPSWRVHINIGAEF